MYAAFLPVGNFLTSSASDLDPKAGSCSSSCGSEEDCSRCPADVQQMSINLSTSPTYSSHDYKDFTRVFKRLNRTRHEQ